MSRLLENEITSYDASEIASAILARRKSVVDVVGAHFDRIERLNSRFNAVVTLDKSRAFTRARQADSDLAAGRLWGPLHGVPITVKDAFQTEGLRTTAGHAPLRKNMPAVDAWAVKAMKEAGAIVIGKSNCAKLCGDIQTKNAVFGITNNPWNVSRTSGGSSGGDAVAVAVGMSCLGIGSDTGGSIRIPSSYCGIFGFKPSAGSIPLDGLLPLRPQGHARPDSLTVVGVVARSTRDLVLVNDVLTRGPNLSAPARAPRVFWTHDFAPHDIDDEVKAILASRRAELLASGADVRDVPCPMDFGKLFSLYWKLHMFEFMPRESAPGMYYAFWSLARLRTMFKGGLDVAYQRLKQAQASLSARFQAFMNDCDCWVLPATPTTAFEHRKTGAAIPLCVGNEVADRGYWQASSTLTYPFNLLGNPSVVLPVGIGKSGLPVAIQVVGKIGDDANLLKFAERLSAMLGIDEFSRRQFTDL